MTNANLAGEHLSVTFGGFTALRDVTLSFEAGRVYGIIGPNGAGKTTFANVLSGIVAPTAGSLVLDGRDITREPLHRRARLGIGRSFQIINIFGAMSVLENLRMGAQATRFTVQPFWRTIASHPELLDRAESMLRFVRLEPMRDQLAGTLSHGDQRALEIGLALMSDPRILILDEPLAGVGQEGTERALRLVRDAARGRTMIIIEHNMDAIMALSDRIVVLVGGRVLAVGSPDEIRHNDAVRVAYLGTEDDSHPGA